MNFHLSATIDAETRVGKQIITKYMDLIQTPTKVTREILNSNDIKQAYFNWVLSCRSKDEERPIYKGILNPIVIRYETYNWGKHHIKEVEKFLEKHKGWDIEWYEM